MGTGLYLWPARLSWPAYFGSLAVHVAVGLALLVVGPVITGVHLAETASQGRGSKWPSPYIR
jgi:hypothetical protein